MDPGHAQARGPALPGPATSRDGPCFKVGNTTPVAHLAVEIRHAVGHELVSQHRMSRQRPWLHDMRRVLLEGTLDSRVRLDVRWPS